MKLGMVDIHSHILPQVDDGASSVEMALEMLKAEAGDGVSDVFLTPHFYAPHEHSSALLKRFENFCEIAKKECPNITLHLGEEVFYSADIPELLEKKEIVTMGNSPYMLVEFSPHADFDFVFRAVSSLMQNGIQPIVAHIERINDIRVTHAEELVRAGAYLQLNTGSIYGRCALRLKRKSFKFLDEELIHFIGSDAHNLGERGPDMGCAYEYVAQKISKEYADEIFIENPHALIRGEYL